MFITFIRVYSPFRRLIVITNILHNVIVRYLHFKLDGYFMTPELIPLMIIWISFTDNMFALQNA